MTIKLSICIPTYNRSACLKEAIESVLPQLTPEVEIVVCDNASTDDTEQLVSGFQQSYPNIRYYKNPENLGADRNFLKVIEVASGEYCWYLGSDDALAEGAVFKLMSVLGGADVYLVGKANMSFDMKRCLSITPILNAESGDIFDCADKDERHRYFRAANSITSLFSFLSSLVVRRSLWQQQEAPEELIGSCWIHVGMIFQMLKSGAKIQYLAEPLALQRRGNDSFQAAVGYTKRRLIDLDFERVARLVFGDDSIEHQLTIGVLKKQYLSLGVMLSDKRSSILSDGVEAVEKLASVYRRYGFGFGWRLNILIFSLSPLPLLNFLREIRLFFSRRGAES